MSENQDVYHITPFRTYIRVFLILVVLTVLTVAVAQVDFGPLNALIAFAIATVKALYVMGYFMHLKFDSIANRVIVGTSLFFLFVLFAICAIDFATRIPVESTF